MPSARIIASAEFDVEPTFHQSTIPVVNGNKLLLVAIGARYHDGYGRVFVADITDRKFREAKFGYLAGSPDKSECFRLVDFFVKGNALVARGLHYAEGSNKISEVVVTVDLTFSGEPIAFSSDHEFSRSFNDPGFSQVLHPNLFIVDSGGAICLIDIEHWRITCKDLGFGEYHPWPSHKIFIKDNDIHMFIGRHLNGDPHRIMALYQGKVIKILEALGGGSPRATIGGAYVPAYGRQPNIIVPLTNGSVVGASNKIGLYDDDGNKIMELHPNPRNFDTPNYHGGIFILNAPDQFTLDMFVYVADNSLGPENRRSLCYVQIDLAGKQVKNVSEILRIDDSDLGADHKYGELNMFSNASCWAARPLVDLRNMKMYLVFKALNTSNNKWTVKLIEVDISDIKIGILNMNAWYIY